MYRPDCIYALTSDRIVCAKAAEILKLFNLYTLLGNLGGL